MPLFDIDPDIQYFAEPHFSNQSPCEYLLEDEFADRWNSHNEIDKGCLYCVIILEVFLKKSTKVH